MITNTFPIYSALMSPTDDDGRVDLDALSMMIEFVLERGVTGIVLGGATGEYASFSLEERKQLVREVKKQVDGRVPWLVGIGAQTIKATLSLGRLAAEENCDGVLLPMPYFFRYRADDLSEYCKIVGRSMEVPCLLYNLPQFTNSVEINELAKFLASETSIAGVKDSSGAQANLAVLAEARKQRHFDLFIGNDSMVLDALTSGWDGGISGLACFVPELLVELANGLRSGDMEKAKRMQVALDELIEQVDRLPIPWAIRIGLGARGFQTGSLPLPASDQRRREIEAFRKWCGEWLDRQSWVRPLAASYV